MGQQFRPGDMAKQLTRGEMVALGGCVVFILFSFFPWISAGVEGFSVSQNGLHDWGLLAVLVVLATAAFVALRSALLRSQVQLPAVPAEDWMIIVGGGAIALLATLLYWVHNHASSDSSFGVSFSTSQSFGWYVCLLAAAAIIAGGVLRKTEPVVAAVGPGIGGPGGGTPAQYAAPNYGATPAQPQYGSPQYGTPGQQAPAAPTYTPPAAPPAAPPAPGYGTPPPPAAPPAGYGQPPQQP